MPLDFPTSPTNGQTYNGYVYSTSVGAWQTKPNAQSPFYTSDTPPGNPVTGDSWFNTNDGTMYIYTYDGNSYQWVEHRSQIAKSQVGLVPITPTSVTISGGTATISGNGRVAFTAGTTGLTLNGVFSSAYRNYKVVSTGFKSASAANDFLYYRLTLAGTEATTNYYQASVAFAMSNGALQNLGGTGATSFMASRIYTSGAYFSCTGDIFNPFLASYTMYNGQAYGTTLSDDQQLVTSGLNYNNTSYDGLKILPTGASISGEISIYGYN
jgi:hypothetical protein